MRESKANRVEEKPLRLGSWDPPWINNTNPPPWINNMNSPWISMDAKAAHQRNQDRPQTQHFLKQLAKAARSTQHFLKRGLSWLSRSVSLFCRKVWKALTAILLHARTTHHVASHHATFYLRANAYGGPLWAARVALVAFPLRRSGLAGTCQTVSPHHQDLTNHRSDQP